MPATDSLVPPISRPNGWSGHSISSIMESTRDAGESLIDASSSSTTSNYAQDREKEINSAWFKTG